MAVDDDLITQTSREQKKLTETVGGLYKLAHEHLLGEEKIVLRRAEHIAYLQRGLEYMGPGYAVLDSSRPWLCYWILHSLALLGQPITPDVRARCIDFLKRCQDPRGGYGGGPGQIPHLATTYAAVCALVTVGGERALDSIDRTKLLDFLLRMKADNGGFHMHEDGEIDVRGSYCAMAVAHILNLANQELTAGVAEYIATCQTYEGGIGGEPGVEAHGGYTFCGLATAMLVGQAQILDLPRLLSWLVFRQGAVEGGFQGRTNKLVDGCYSFWQGGTFLLLQRLMPQLLSQGGERLRGKGEGETGVRKGEGETGVRKGEEVLWGDSAGQGDTLEEEEPVPDEKGGRGKMQVGEGDRGDHIGLGGVSVQEHPASGGKGEGKGNECRTGLSEGGEREERSAGGKKGKEQEKVSLSEQGQRESGVGGTETRRESEGEVTGGDVTWERDRISSEEEGVSFAKFSGVGLESDRAAAQANPEDMRSENAEQKNPLRTGKGGQTDRGDDGSGESSEYETDDEGGGPCRGGIRTAAELFPCEPLESLDDCGCGGVVIEEEDEGTSKDSGRAAAEEGGRNDRSWEGGVWGEPLFNPRALQAYILLCCQQAEGGLRDKPGKSRDYYHTCYCLSGLSAAQRCHNESVKDLPRARHVLGPYENLLEAADPICNVHAERYAEAIAYFANRTLR